MTFSLDPTLIAGGFSVGLLVWFASNGLSKAWNLFTWMFNG